MKLLLSDFFYSALISFFRKYSNSFVLVLIGYINGNNTTAAYPYTLYASQKISNIIYLYFSTGCQNNLIPPTLETDIVFGTGNCNTYTTASLIIPCWNGSTTTNDCLRNLPFTLLYQVLASTATFIVKITLPPDIT